MNRNAVATPHARATRLARLIGGGAMLALLAALSACAGGSGPATQVNQQSTPPTSDMITPIKKRTKMMARIAWITRGAGSGSGNRPNR